MLSCPAATARQVFKKPTRGIAVHNILLNSFFITRFLSVSMLFAFFPVPAVRRGWFSHHLAAGGRGCRVADIKRSARLLGIWEAEARRSQRDASRYRHSSGHPLSVLSALGFDCSARPFIHFHFPASSGGESETLGKRPTKISSCWGVRISAFGLYIGRPGVVQGCSIQPLSTNNPFHDCFETDCLASARHQSFSGRSSTGATKFQSTILSTIKFKAIMAKELTIQEQRELLTNPIIQEVKKFEIQQRMAQMYATSGIVPKTYDKNIGGCVIAIDMAMRMTVNPLAVMQNLNIVYGMPSWSAKFLVACINRCGRFTELEYEKVGDDASKKNYKCRAFAYAKNDIKKEHPLYGAWITWPMVDGEGWSKKNGSKWLTMPEQMFMYRAASFWSSAYAPDISLGFPTTDEVMDGAVVDVDAEAIPVPEPVKEEPSPVGDDNAAVDQATGEAKEDQVKEQPAANPTSPADAIKQAIKKQTANQPAADKPGERQEGNLFEQQQ